MTNIKVLPLAIIGTIVGLVVGVLLIVLSSLPAQASAQSLDIDNVYFYMLAFAGIIFGIVTIFLVTAVYRFRARPNDTRDGPPQHGHTWLEVIWTLIPFVLIVILGYGGWWLLDTGDVEAQARAEGQQIHVVAYQFGWKYDYLNGNVELKQQSELVLPVNEAVIFELTTLDVIHSFWVPAWRMQMNATPGQVNQMSVTPIKIGTYEIVCAFLCGIGHSGMNSAIEGSIIPRVRVVSRADFDKWVAERKAEAAKQAEQATTQTTTAGVA